MFETMTATRNVTVNAAFLKEIKDDNLQLKALWDKIIPMVAHHEMVANHWPKLIELLSELRDQLALHFSLEEAYGYFDDAVDIAPRLSIASEALRAQHSTLFETCRNLAEEINEVDHDEPEHCERFMAKFHAFQSQFESHEEQELKLILQSLDDDLGVGD